ncbi:hypothetical protein ACJJTC_007028 [Scirpophaga incertulas]
MDSRPPLCQYFGDTEVPPASQFFDEIGTSPSDMIQSVYLGDGGGNSASLSTSLFGQTSLTQSIDSQDNAFADIVPTVSGSTALPAKNLPDPSTFFDTIGPEPQIPLSPNYRISSSAVLVDAMEGLTIKNQLMDIEEQRRRDAWIPDDEALRSIVKAQSSPSGSFFPDRESLTMPGLVLEEELPDALQEVSVKYLGVSAAGSRGVVRAEHVSRDEAGVRELLRTGYLRAAVNLTGSLITATGQGAGRMQRPTKHTPRSLQLWLTRFAVMLRLKLHEPLTMEAEPFGDFSKPDMFYQFYPETYGNRTGSLVPFSLRLLVAELPGHVGKPEEALERLVALQHVISQMLSNLNEGKTEDGSGNITSEQDKMESTRLWTGRETRVQHSIVNCAIAMKDFRLASHVLGRMTSPGAGGKRAQYSAMGRLWLAAGHIRAATRMFKLASEERSLGCPTPDVREYVDCGLLDISYGKYQEAYNNFVKAADQEPTNIMVANNIAVCLLYMGRLKEAIGVLQKAINSAPERALNESLLVNLCTLYELESSKTNEKKLNLLRMLCKYKSDTIPNILECLKLS